MTDSCVVGQCKPIPNPKSQATCARRLLGTFGGENIPCCGFGFGDAVIVELLKECNKIPVLKHQVCAVCCSCAATWIKFGTSST